jgi:hypothetical protein
MSVIHRQDVGSALRVVVNRTTGQGSSQLVAPRQRQFFHSIGCSSTRSILGVKRLPLWALGPRDSLVCASNALPFRRYTRRVVLIGARAYRLYGLHPLAHCASTICHPVAK